MPMAASRISPQRKGASTAPRRSVSPPSQPLPDDTRKGVVPDQRSPDNGRGARPEIASDQPSAVDRLLHQRYAQAIATFLTHGDTQTPVSVSIQAPWGSGKSSLMRMIQAQLDPNWDAAMMARYGDHLSIKKVLSFLDQKIAPKNKSTPHGAPAPATDQYWSVWFNASQYQNSEQVWAGMVDAIVTHQKRFQEPF